MNADELKTILADHALWLSNSGKKRANLRWADLRWANLRWADLSGANLSGADQSWANLRAANLSDSSASKKPRYATGTAASQGTNARLMPAGIPLMRL